MAEMAVKESEAINKVFEGIDGAVKETVLIAIEFFGKEKSDAGKPIEDIVKVTKLRNAYNTLVSALINERMNKLNRHQSLFLTTGAIGDVATINDKEVKLLDPKIYSALLEVFDKKDKSNPFSDLVYTPLEKMKALAEGTIELIDTSGKKKRNKSNEVDPKKAKADLDWKINDDIKAGDNIIRTSGNIIDKLMQIDATKLKNFKLNYDALVRYFSILKKRGKATPEEKKLKDAFATKSDAIGRMLADFTKLYAEAFGRANENVAKLKERVDGIKEKEIEYARVSTQVAAEVDAKVDSYTSDHTDVIKRDISIINSFIVSAAEKSSNRVPFSGARVLIDSQIPDMEKAMDNYFCTTENVLRSLEKIAKIHTNAFPKDQDGNFIIPPILIEPIRNYVDFLEDRFIMGFISGEPGRKGAKVSFSPVDFQVMKAVGMFLAKDPIYDYRGEINEGTFMGDYTGKIEKTAQVKWTGEQKKMNMVMSAELVDAASREDAVQNYIDFVFNAVNGLGPPPKMSKRKINVLLRYATIESIENNVKLLLQYVAQSEPTEVRDTILKYTNRSYDTAKDMVRTIVKEDAMVQRTLGNNPEFVIAKIFV